MIPPPTAYPYWYSTQYTTTLTTTSTTTMSIRFEEGTIFEAHSFYAWTSLDLVSTIQSAMFLCKISDQGTGQQLSNGYVIRTAIFGSLDHLDGALPTPIQFSGKSTLNFDIQNISGSSMVGIYLAVAGLRWTAVPMTNQ